MIAGICQLSSQTNMNMNIDGCCRLFWSGFASRCFLQHVSHVPSRGLRSELKCLGFIWIMAMFWKANNLKVWACVVKGHTVYTMLVLCVHCLGFNVFNLHNFGMPVFVWFDCFYCLSFLCMPLYLSNPDISYILHVSVIMDTK